MIFITGNSGFIGSYLTSFLVKNGYSLRGFDVAPKRIASADYPHVIGDLLDEKVVKRAMTGCESVIHLAAEHKDSGISRECYFHVNEDGTKCLLRCASELGIKKFIFFSSVAVYGDQQGATEETTPRPVTPYGESKLAAEQAVVKWAGEDPQRMCIVIRPAVVFGPNNRANIFKLIKYVCDGKFIWVGNGENVKSIAYVENLVRATHFLIERMCPGVQILNYVDEPQMTTRELVDLIASKAGKPVPTLSIPEGIALFLARIGDGIASLTNRNFPVSAARIKKFNTSTRYSADKIRFTGFKAPYTIEEGLAKSVRWYLDEVQTRKNDYTESWER